MGIGTLARIVKGVKQDHDLAWLCYPIVLSATLSFYMIVFASSKEGRQVFGSFAGKDS